jgi:outer membrane protein assembly factor BamA
MFRIFLIMTMLLWRMQAQTPSFPLESVSVEGTALSKDLVLELAGLHVGSPIDKAAMETASQKLGESGLFESSSYRYSPGPKHGYALTLQLADSKSLLNASIDIPGINEDEAWKWLAARYPSLDHKVPESEAAQRFVEGRLEEHAGAVLEGHHVTGKLASQLGPGGRATISFQPDPLPRIAALSFTGEKELNAEELAALIPKDVREQGYTDRIFRQAVELNLRRAYEDRGMYRVRFPNIAAHLESDWSVSVLTTVEEGAKYVLGDIQLVGNQLPVDAMLKAAKFRKGDPANWSEIQSSLWELEKPVKRLGYLNASAKPQRILRDNPRDNPRDTQQDDQRVLDLRISMNLGPLYKFGQLQITGLTPNLEAQARKIWSLKTGDPFDYDYPKDFFRDFFRSVDSQQFNKFNVKMQKGAGENVMDFALAFEPR